MSPLVNDGVAIGFVAIVVLAADLGSFVSTSSGGDSKCLFGSVLWLMRD